MSDKKISQLTPATTSGGNDLVPIVQGGINKKSTPNILGANYSATGLTTITVGGLPAGSNITNQNAAAIIQAITSPYIHPTFTAFAISGVSTQEVGQKIVGIKNFTWTISDPTHAAANSINIYDLILPQTLVTGHSITSPASFDFGTLPGGGVELDIPGTYSWQIEATDTDVPPSLFTRNLNISWMWRRHWGFSALSALTGADVLALASSDLSTVGTGTFSFGATGYKWFCIPSSFAQPTTFKDQSTGLDVAMEIPTTVSVTNTFGVVTNYSCYRTTNILGSSINIIIS